MQRSSCSTAIHSSVMCASVSPPGPQTMVGIPARPLLVDAAEYQKPFVPYGTPCSERFDPATQQLEILKCEVEQLQKRIAELVEAKDEKARRNRA
mgnify:CR=1 FL=1